MYIDHFGNCITTISRKHLGKQMDRKIQVSTESAKKIPFCRCYDDVPVGDALCVTGSAGFLELSVNCGNAAEELWLKRGDKVIIRPV